MIVSAEERRPGEGQSRRSMTVDYGVDFFSGGEVRDGEHVVADLNNSDRTTLGGNVENGVPCVHFAAGGVRVEPGVQALTSQLASEDHGVGDRAVGSSGVGHAVERDGRRIEVAFPVDAGGIYEFLVLRYAARGLEVFAEESANGLQVEVDDAVGFRQEAGGLGWGLRAKEDGEGQQRQDTGYDQKRSTRAFVHWPWNFGLQVPCTG